MKITKQQIVEFINEELTKTDKSEIKSMISAEIKKEEIQKLLKEKKWQWLNMHKENSTR